MATAAPAIPVRSGGIMSREADEHVTVVTARLGLSTGAMATLRAIAHFTHQDRKTPCYAGQPRLANWCSCDVRTIRRRIDALAGLDGSGSGHPPLIVIDDKWRGGRRVMGRPCMAIWIVGFNDLPNNLSANEGDDIPDKSPGNAAGDTGHSGTEIPDILAGDTGHSDRAYRGNQRKPILKPTLPTAMANRAGDFNSAGFAKGWTLDSRAAIEAARHDPASAHIVVGFIDQVRAALNPPQNGVTAIAFVQQLVGRLATFDGEVLRKTAAAMKDERGRDLPSAIEVAKTARVIATRTQQPTAESTPAWASSKLKNISRYAPEWAPVMAMMTPEEVAGYRSASSVTVTVEQLAAAMAAYEGGRGGAP